MESRFRYSKVGNKHKGQHAGAQFSLMRGFEAGQRNYGGGCETF
jgi:hypothetical protein